MERKGFAFLRSYKEAIDEIDNEHDKLLLYEALAEYGLNDKVINIDSKISKALFLAMKPNIKNSNKRYDANIENGKKGGAPKGNKNAKKQPKNNPKLTQKQPKNNLDIDKDIDKDKEIDIDIDKDKDIYIKDPALFKVISDACVDFSKEEWDEDEAY